MPPILPRVGSVVVVFLLYATWAYAQTDATEFFESRIRPLLADNCVACHSKEALGGLRLDSREALLEGGNSGPAIVPGDPEASLLMIAVRHVRDDLQMPMSADKLSERQIQDLARWIEMDAPWPASAVTHVASNGDLPTPEERAFWSFRPIERFDVPEIRDEPWATNAIDRFVRRKLEEEGLEPVAPASKRDLIRRVTFDLIGLPPTPDEVEAFANDTSPDAYEKLVDRLLASPHYGETWGRHWLDVVRFGEDDTRGLAKDGSGQERYGSAYVYRDWVVRAFNEDMPYDLFVKAQFAGDLLDEDVRARAIGGLGFLGGGPWYYDIAEPAVARADERHDRVDVTSRGFLGLTVGCARCHDHKFDPLTMRDYYGLAGVFYNTDYHEYPVAPSAEVEAFEKEKKYIEALEKELEDYLETETKQLARLLARQSARYMVAAWKVTGEPEIPVEKAANEDELDLETLQRFIRFLDKEPQHYPYLEDWQAMIATGGTEEEARELGEKFQRLLMEIVAEKKKLQEKNEWIIANGSPPPDERKSVAMPNDFESFFDEHQLELETIDREKLNLWTDVFARDLDGTIDLYKPKPGLLVFKDWGLERRLSRVSADYVRDLREEIERRKKEMPQQYPFVMGVRDKEESELEDIKLHLRGNPHALGDPVPRRFPAVLCNEAPAPFDEGSGRLELAEAIVRHPLASRVIVNRIWRWHFGTGLVDTPSNFGRLGERPSHPELLEYLAGWFVDHGMSIKKLHREILASSTYRLSTALSETNFEKDGANRLYWRANRRRIDAESIRDAILFVSGGLDPEVGGPSLDLSDEKNRRRTVYGRVSRFRLDDYLLTFDFPNPNLSAEQRFTTNVPLQSLFFMNSDFVKREAERLVYRLSGRELEDGVENGEAKDGEATTGKDVSWIDEVPDEEKIRKAYRLLFAREVTEEELAAGVEFLEASANSEEPLAPWIQYARVLLGTNEFRFLN